MYEKSVLIQINKRPVWKKTAMNLIRERLDFKNTFVRELLHVWKTNSKTTPKWTIVVLGILFSISTLNLRHRLLDRTSTLPSTTLKITYWRKRPWTRSESHWNLKIRIYHNSCIFLNQVKNHSRIDNSVNNQNSKTSKSNFSEAWKEKRNNILDIMIQTSLFSLLNIIINIVGSRVSNLILFLSWDELVKFRNIKKKLGI